MDGEQKEVGCEVGSVAGSVCFATSAHSRRKADVWLCLDPVADRHPRCLKAERAASNTKFRLNAESAQANRRHVIHKLSVSITAACALLGDHVAFCLNVVKLKYSDKYTQTSDQRRQNEEPEMVMRWSALHCVPQVPVVTRWAVLDMNAKETAATDWPDRPNRNKHHCNSVQAFRSVEPP